MRPTAILNLGGPFERHQCSPPARSAQCCCKANRLADRFAIRPVMDGMEPADAIIFAPCADATPTFGPGPRSSRSTVSLTPSRRMDFEPATISLCQKNGGIGLVMSIRPRLAGSYLPDHSSGGSTLLAAAERYPIALPVWILQSDGLPSRSAS